MRLKQLTEGIRLRESALKGIGLYPGRFQPMHKGHKGVFDYVNSKYDHAYVVTSDKTDKLKNPFNFQEKKQMASLLGVPDNQFAQVKNPYQASEVLDNFDADQHYVVFFISQKDMDESPRFRFPSKGPAVKKNGEPAYLQQWNGNPQPFSKHAYIAVAPTTDFKVLGQPIKSASELRSMLMGDEETAQKAFVDVYGKFDPKIFAMVRDKLGALEEDADNAEADQYRRWGQQGKFIYGGHG
jgi:hypothetical protein